MKIDQLQLNQNQLTDLKGKKDVKGFEKAAKEFEAYFVAYLLKKMRDTVPKGGLLDPGTGGDVYTSLMDDNVAQGIAGSGGLGLSQLLIRQWTSGANEKDGKL
ncbi:MAG: rod-binding protein [Nitrospirae bacterium]|nr:rod-binding protein [Nitrospirota bacterium]